MRKTVKNYVYQVSYNLLNMLLPLITAPYLARILGAEGVGHYAYYFAIAQYFTIFAKLGLTHYGTRQIAEVRDHPQLLKDVFTNIYMMQIGAVTVAVAVYIGFLFLLAQDRQISFIFGIWLFCVAFDTDWLLFGLEDFRSPAIRNFIVKGFSTAAVFLTVKSAKDLNLYAIITAVSYALGYVALWMKCRQYIDLKSVMWHKVISHLKPCCVLLISILALNLYRSMDKVMLGAISGMYETGLYEYAEKIVYCLSTLIASLGSVMLPKISHLKAKQDHKSREKLIMASMEFVLFMTCGMAFGLISISNSLIPVLFGESFRGSVPLLNLLAVTLILIGWGNVIRSQYVIPEHLDQIYVFTVSAGAAVNLIANALLIPRFAAIGACIGTILAEITVPVMQGCFLNDKLPYRKFVGQSIPYLLIGAIMCVVLKNMERHLSAGLMTMLLQMLIGAMIYGGVSACYFKIHHGKQITWI